MKINVVYTSLSRSIALIVILSGILGAQPGWDIIETPTNEQLNKVSFVDTQTGWAAGFNGAIIKTSDGGDSWVDQSRTFNQNISSIYMINTSTGWAVAPVFPDGSGNEPGSKILKTIDGGDTWIEQFYPDRFFLAVTFFDELTGWIAGLDGVFAKTIDGGITWSETISDTAIGAFFSVRHLQYFSDQLILGVGGEYDRFGVAWRSTNGGERWEPYALGSEPYFSVHFFDDQNFLVMGGDFEFGVSRIVSSNGGESWTYDLLNIFGIATALSFRTENEVWAALGNSGRLMVSEDAGQNWTWDFAPDNSVIYDLVFVDSTTGIGVGENGRVIKYRPETVSVDRPESVQPGQFELIGNFPNPFNPSTTIAYQLEKAGEVEVTIYNALGQLVTTLYEGYQPIGRHQIQWKPGKLPSGTYWYKLKTDQHTVVRRMQLIK